jgi:hypothetical protein
VVGGGLLVVVLVVLVVGGGGGGGAAGGVVTCVGAGVGLSRLGAGAGKDDDGEAINPAGRVAVGVVVADLPPMTATAIAVPPQLTANTAAMIPAMIGSVVGLRCAVGTGGVLGWPGRGVW